MASEPIKTKYFGTGNFEILFELTNSVVLKGSGRHLRGFSLLGRYNLLLPDPKWALYFQIGAGVIVNDAYRDLSLSAIGQAIVFTPQGSIGLHYFIGCKLDRGRGGDVPPCLQRGIVGREKCRNK
jgi:hypothetical protein